MCNATRPVVSLARWFPEYPPSIFAQPRRLQYFGSQSCDGRSYLAAAEAIARRGADSVGLKTGGNAREYPLWVLTRTRGLEGPLIQHVEVENVSRSTRGREVRPDLVVELVSKQNSCEALLRQGQEGGGGGLALR